MWAGRAHGGHVPGARRVRRAHEKRHRYLDGGDRFFYPCAEALANYLLTYVDVEKVKEIELEGSHAEDVILDALALERRKWGEVA